MILTLLVAVPNSVDLPVGETTTEAAHAPSDDHVQLGLCRTISLIDDLHHIAVHLVIVVLPYFILHTYLSRRAFAAPTALGSGNPLSILVCGVALVLVVIHDNLGWL